MNCYKIFEDGKGKTVVVSTYAGHDVRGVAKCSPSDSYNREKGVGLATARCDFKIAGKRRKNAYMKYQKARQEAAKAAAYSADMYEYYIDSVRRETEAERTLEAFESEM